MFKNVSRKLKKDQRGLTLVELLAVVVILAIVSAIAFVLIGNVIDNSKKDAHIANAQQIISAVKLSEASGDVVISKGENLDVISTGKPVIKSLDTIIDPWKKKAYPTVNVQKDAEGLYAITIALDSAVTKADCSISTRKEADLQKDRDTACGKTVTPPAGG